MASRSVEKTPCAGRRAARASGGASGGPGYRSNAPARTAGPADLPFRISPPRRPRRSCCAGHRASHARAAAIELVPGVRSAPAPNAAPRRTPPSPPHTAAARRKTGSAGRALVFARHNDLALRIDRVKPKTLLFARSRPTRVTVDKFRIDLLHGRASFRWGFDNDHLGTLMPFGASSTPSFLRSAIRN